MTTPRDKPPLSQQSINKAMPRLDFDPERYRKYLDEFEFTQTQENEMLKVLWNIMSTMVDIGWGVDNVQMFLPDLFEKSGTDSDKLLQITTPSFNAEAAHNKRKNSINDQ